MATTIRQPLQIKNVAPAYMPQLDGLRAIAVGAVMLHHSVPGGWSFGASLGVKLFFAISGFLITGILLKARQSVEKGSSTNAGALARFYARRILRIFPLYYLVVAVTFAMDLKPVRQIIGWLLTYTLNLHMAHQGWYEIHFAHFWSLAVEEQFYLCWPWLVLLLPRKWLFPAIVALISVGPLYRLSYVLSGYTNMSSLSIYIATPTCLDHLGFGALLALAVQRFPRRVISRTTVMLFPVGLAASVVLMRWIRGAAEIVLLDMTLACASCCVIYLLSNGLHALPGRLLASKPMVYIGRISYGLYVYHPFMQALVISMLVRFGLKCQHYCFRETALALALTLLVASASWRWFEAPINDLKRHF